MQGRSLFSVLVGLAVATVVLAPGGTLAGHGHNGNPPVWYAVDPQCVGTANGLPFYIYNEDNDGDGNLDQATFFWSENAFTVADSWGHFHHFHLYSPAQELAQVALTWYGYSADGSCTWTPNYATWNLKYLPKSNFGGGTFTQPHVTLSVGLTVKPGDTIQIAEDFLPYEIYTLKIASPFYGTGGFWGGRVWDVNDHYFNADFGLNYWARSYTYAWSVSSWGHPVVPSAPEQDQSFSASPTGALLWALNPLPTENVMFSDPSGAFTADGWSLGAGWYAPLQTFEQWNSV